MPSPATTVRERPARPSTLIAARPTNSTGNIAVAASAKSTLPAPLFAGFVALSLVDPDRSAASIPVLGATAGALLVAPSRSFPIVLAGGIAGYAVASALT